MSDRDKRQAHDFYSTEKNPGCCGVECMAADVKSDCYFVMHVTVLLQLVGENPSTREGQS